MPTFNITLEDTSPLLRYSQNWGAGTSDDSSADKYSESSFMVTESQAATMELDFYGTSVTLFGATRGNHGVYQGQLDGSSLFTRNGSGPDAFQQALYTANSTLGSHSMIITNGENRFFDVDYVTFQTNVGHDGEDLIINSFQDNHPSFVYTPSSLWFTTGNKVSWFSGSNGHFTNQSSAVVKFTFQGGYNETERRLLFLSLVNLLRSGDAVVLYGAVGPQGGAYSVQVDNNPSTSYSSKKTFFLPKEVIFYAGNLGEGNHSLQLQLSSSVLSELSIDYADVYTTTSLGGSPLGVLSSNNAIAHGSDGKTPTGIIAGLAVTSALALIATLAVMYMLWRRRQDIYSQKTTPIPPMGYHNPTSTQGTPAASSTMPIIDHASPTTFTASVFSYPSASVPSTGGAPSSASSGGAIASTAAQSTSRYLPQGKRNAAAASTYPSMSRSDTSDGGGGEIRERRNTEILPPQYSEG